MLKINVLKHDLSVYFCIEYEGNRLARSRYYRSICDLEAALVALGEVTSPQVLPNLNSTGNTCVITARGRRERVTLFEVESVDSLRATINSLSVAEIVDLRPSKGIRLRIGGTPKGMQSIHNSVA